MNNKLVLQSIAGDLKRVALSLARNSPVTADRFTQEVIRRKSELDSSSLDPYIKKIIDQLESSTHDPDMALMYSTLLQNYTLYHYASASS